MLNVCNSTYAIVLMKTDDAVAYFGTKTRLAHALGISLPAISQWGQVVPKGRAYEIQALTKGALAVDTSLYGVRETVRSAR